MEKRFFNKKETINCNGRLLDLKVPKVMGILNITPDSFYDGGRYKNLDDIRLRIDQMITEGVDILDIGAYSSRPGAEHIDTDAEIARLKPVLELCRIKYPELIVSVDTFRSQVAAVAVRDFGVAIINDISAGDMDEKMFETISSLQVPYIMMHMQGTPANMQKNPVYEHVVEDIIRCFSQKLDRAKSFGIHDVILDPGFGFGKTIDHNYQLMNGLQEFRIFNVPVLVGVSRKSMIYKLLDCSPQDALAGTIALNTIALINGASVLRVHDVKEAKQTIQLVQKLKEQGLPGFK